MDEVTAGDFTAESLEHEADRLPPSRKKDAEVLRKAARIYRELGGKKKIRVLRPASRPKP